MIRNDVFETPGNLTYTSCNVNQGLGMNISNGFFTAPTAGTYLFTFHANTVS